MAANELSQSVMVFCQRQRQREGEEQRKVRVNDSVGDSGYKIESFLFVLKLFRWIAFYSLHSE